MARTATTTDQWLTVAVCAVNDHGAKQKPEELAQLLSLAHPSSVVVEVGCDQGGTLWAFRQTGATVIGVTLQSGWFASGAPLYGHGCPVILADSHDPTTLAKLRFQLQGRKIDLLIIDADHRYPAVLADFTDYGALVNEDGGMIALHDICHHEPIDIPGGTVVVGVEQLWGEITAHFPLHQEIVCEPRTWGGFGLVMMS